MHVKSVPSTPRPFATFPILAAAAVQSSPIIAFSAGLIAAWDMAALLTSIAAIATAAPMRAKLFINFSIM
jgi:hypothetical protein